MINNIYLYGPSTDDNSFIQGTSWQWNMHNAMLQNMRYTDSSAF